MTEDQLLSAVVELAKFAGFKVCHFRPARTEKGWRTAVQGHKGFPDVIIAGHTRFIVAEVKTAQGSLTDEQARWRLELDRAGVEYHLWRPQDWDEGTIARELGCEGAEIPRRHP